MMKPEIAVLDIQGQYRIHTEFYRCDNAENTIILVNGSMATTASFSQTLKNLHPHLNVVLYDQPYAGKSKPHNPHQKMLTRELEAQVLLELIEHFDANYLLSFSWGGTAALTALASSPRRIEKAVISSFSPLINEAMRDYLERGRHCLAARNRTQVGNLVNDTLGKHLPPLFKRFNFRHVSTLAEHEYAQMHFHINHVLNSDQQGFLGHPRHRNPGVVYQWRMGRVHRSQRCPALCATDRQQPFHLPGEHRALSGYGAQICQP